VKNFVKRRPAVLAALVVLMSSLGAVLTAVPASAAAQCDGISICFFQHWQSTGSMSDRTAELTRHFEPSTMIDGRIPDFKAFGYFNAAAGTLDDSVSTIVNNSNSCLYLWGNPNYKKPFAHPYEWMILGPRTTVTLWSEMQSTNDKLSSARTEVSWSPDCSKRKPNTAYFDAREEDPS
jgi:hypothetical protein